MAGLTVQAWDRDRLHDDLLGSAVVDDDGTFTIAFDGSYFQERFDLLPDVFFRVFDGDTLIADTRDSVVCNLAAHELDVVIHIDLPLPDGPEPPDVGRDAVLAVHGAATRTPAEVRAGDAELYRDLQGRALAELRRILDEGFARSSEALQKHVRGLDLRPLAAGGVSIADYLRASLRRGDLDDLVRAEGRIRIAELALPDTLGSLLRPDTPLRDNPIFAAELARADTYRLAAFAELDEATVAALHERSLHPGNLGDEHLEALVGEQVVDRDGARALGLDANLYAWSGGKTELIGAVKEEVARKTGAPSRHLRDLAALERADYADILEKTGVELDIGGDREAQAAYLAGQIEALFPEAVWRARHRPVETAALSQSLGRLQPVFATSAEVFGRAAAPDLSQLDEQERGPVMEAFAGVNRVVNRHAGLRLDELLGDPQLSAEDKVTEVARRVDLIPQLHRLNPTVAFTSLDTVWSDDLEETIDFGDMSEEDRALVVEEVRADQRMLRLTGGHAEHAAALREVGYQSALDLEEDPPSRIAQATGIDLKDVDAYRNNAHEIAKATVAAVGTVFDHVYAGFGDTPVDNAPLEVDTVLRRLPGYADYFGNQGYCRCRHCDSILGPAAYFVDLMEFVETRILAETFAGQRRPERPDLSLYARRRDLWHGVPLTCEHTDTLVPYLVIINEILENYVYAQHHDGEVTDRTAVEDFVYEHLYERGAGADPSIEGFEQPFLLPLERLQIYLSHFPITRADVAATVLEGTGDPTEAIAQARLGMSPAEYALVGVPHAERVEGAYLFGSRGRWGEAVTVPATGEVDPFDAQRLLAPMHVTRKELGRLVEARFVRGGDAIRIAGERLSDGSVQPDIESIYGLTRASLDRMHRFVRLWRRVPWTIGELDLVLHHVGATAADGALPLAEIAALVSLQERLRVEVEELCALFDALSTTPVDPDGQPLFDRLFNQPPFVREAGERWEPDTLAQRFVHPAYSAAGATPDDRTLHRLLAGLRIDDESLLLLLGADAETGFTITHDSLSRLFQHARLAAVLKLSIAELLQLIRLSGGDPGARASGAAALEERVAFHDAWRSTRYSLDDLAFATGGAVREPASRPAAASVVDDVLRGVDERRALVFADTVFAFFDGVTETQSRAIVEVNHAGYFVPEAPGADPHSVTIPAAVVSDLGLSGSASLEAAVGDWLAAHQRPRVGGFRIADLAGLGGLSHDHAQAIADANPGLFAPVTPVIAPVDLALYRVSSAIDLDGDRLDVAAIGGTAELEHSLRERLRTHSLPGAAPFTAEVFTGVGGLSAEDARAVFDANRSFFEAEIDQSLYSLTPAFDAATPLAIPAGVPLAPETAHAHIARFHAAEVLPVALAGRLGVSVERLQALAELAGYDFAEPALASTLTRIVQRSASPEPLVDRVDVLQRLAVAFGERVFTPATLRFLGEHSGATPALFPIRDFETLTIADVEVIARYGALLTGNDDDTARLGPALLGFDGAATPPQFSASALGELAEVLGAEPGLVATLNRVIALPGSGDVPDPALQALGKLRRCVELAQYLGVGGDVLPLIASAAAGDAGDVYRSLDRAADAIFTAFRTKYQTEESWREVIEPFEDAIRERKRDALTDYILRSLDSERFRTPNDLYHWFLIDTELEGCARTSRVVAAISSLQLYVQRCLMRLEQSGDSPLRVTLDGEAARQWQWRKNYRVWEANRKVFLYPEFFLTQEVRDNKTPLFEAAEAQILQQEIDAQSVLDTYSSYLSGFAEVAGLQIAGAFHDRRGGRDVLHLVGVTRTGPTAHYYRTVDNLYLSEERDPTKSKGVVWHPWRPMEVQIPVRQVSPVVVNGTLHVFWVEITTRPNNPFDGYEHTFALKYVSLRLDGSWSAPVQVDLDGRSTVHDPLADASERQRFWASRGLAALGAGVLGRVSRLDEIVDELLAELMRVLKNDISQLEETVTVNADGIELELDMTERTIRDLLAPRFGGAPLSAELVHAGAQDDYTLTGHEWVRVYPDANGRDLHLTLQDGEVAGRMDLFRARLPAGGWPTDVLMDAATEPRMFDVRVSSGLLGHDRDIRIGDTRRVSHFHPYAHAVELSHDAGSGLVGATTVIDGAPDQTLLHVVNGSLHDAIVDADGDLFHVRRYEDPRLPNYILERLGTTLGTRLQQILFEAGIDGLLDVRTQESELGEAHTPFTFRGLLTMEDADFFNDAKKAIEKGIPDFTGPLGVYFREIFFHLPLLIAEHLNSKQQYEAADRWFRYIFDPTSDAEPDLTGVTDPEEHERRSKDRVWQYVEFRNRTLQTWREQLNDREALARYENDPFNPHAIARQRLGAYMRSVYTKYIDNLLDWGDHLFALDTTESINEATLLYVMAADLLGERPAELGDCREEDVADEPTYDDLVRRMRACPRAPVTAIETTAGGHARAPAKAKRDLRDMLMTPSKSLALAGKKAIEAAGWRVAGARGAASNGENGTGAAGAFALLPAMWELRDDGASTGPHVVDWQQIDPSVIASFASSLLKQACVFCIPPNRDLHALWDRVEDRLYKIRNCMNISGVRRQLALFAPEIDPRLLVRARAAGLSIEDVLETTSGNLPPYRFSFLVVKAKEYAGVVQGLGAALLRALESKDGEELARLRLNHQKNILDMTTRLRDQEIAAAEARREALERRKDLVTNRRDYYKALKEAGLSGWEHTQVALSVTGHGVKLAVPVLNAAAGAFAMPPHTVGTSFSTPAKGLHEGFLAAANVVNAVGELSLIASSLSATQANFERRAQGWQHQVDVANDELREIDRQLLAEEIRVALAQRSREIHLRTQAQLDEVFDFYAEKFSTLSLYTFLSTTMQGLYRQAYQSALAMARLAERAYRFERDDAAAPVLRGDYWDSSRAGLLAGEKLMSDLREYERRFMETHYRGMEVDQAFSLTQIDPAALIVLKQTGTCEFEIPEAYFDLYYPGQYRRRIKSARLTIPCVTGPYTNVGATLSLVDSKLRVEPKLGDEHLQVVPPTRSVTIATSTAQNDAGVFRLDFSDQRYMPFEGAGAVGSRWRITLPTSFRTFDYSTINDVILHLSYTAEYDERLAEEVEGRNAETTGALLEYFSGTAASRALSLRQEFSGTFHRLLHTPTADGSGAPLEVEERHFPLFLQGRPLRVARAHLVLDVDMDAFLDDDGRMPASIAWPTMTLARDGSSTDPLAFARDPQFGDLPVAAVDFPSSPELDLRRGPTTLSFAVDEPGDFAPGEPSPADPSPLDEGKLKDVILYLEYVVAS